ncbi:hypothetical protein NL676_038692 [Syzygium grande]|nr:hypothetical protein NL676_038692 [Syzygium grande]
MTPMLQTPPPQLCFVEACRALSFGYGDKLNIARARSNSEVKETGCFHHHNYALPSPDKARQALSFVDGNKADTTRAQSRS